MLKMNTERNQVLFATEAEVYVQTLKKFDVKEIGNSRWSQQHEYLEKLNMQAVLSASQQEDEFIKEYLIEYEKISVLIHDLIATETWKQKVFPEFVKSDLKQSILFPVYMVLYHEATVANLLETVLFHRDATEAAEDSILDLSDCCYRKLTHLVAKNQEESEDDDDAPTSLKSEMNMSSLEELQKQNRVLNFDIAIKSLSILRYITDNLPSLPISVMTRILDTQDIPMLLIQLIENPPWTRERKGKLQKYIDNKWQEISFSDRLKLTKIEGQVWLALFQLLMTEDCQRKYELNTYRKNVILKLRSHLTEILLDQLPVLGEMRRYLEQLAVMDPPPIKKDLLLEQVPEIRETFLRENEGKWEKIASIQSQTFFNPSKMDMREQARRLAATYSLDVLDDLLTEPPKCVVCGTEATKRCSRCQNEWYCRRECQVKHWKKHKKPCDLLVDAQNKIKADSAATLKSS